MLAASSLASSGTVTNSNPVGVMLIVIPVIVLMIFVFVYSAFQKRKSKANSVQTEGRIVATRIRERINGANQSYGSNSAKGFYAPDTNFDVTLSIEYVDPESGRTRSTHQKVGMSSARQYLNAESFVISGRTMENMNNVDGIIFSISGVVDAAKEAKRLKAEGKTSDEIKEYFTDVNNLDRIDFITLAEQVPVNLWLDDTRANDRRVTFDWKP